MPAANPNLKNNIAPNMVEMAVRKTGAVPNLFDCVDIIILLSNGKLWNACINNKCIQGTGEGKNSGDRVTGMR